GPSTFSRAGAGVLAAMPGSPFFPGGLSPYTAPANTGLDFELGPSQTVQLQWGTYFDAADQAGLSRIWGGIHPPVDDFSGRRAGAECGQRAWGLARTFWDGSVAAASPTIAIRQLHSVDCELKYATIPSLYYSLQSTPDLNEPFL